MAYTLTNCSQIDRSCWLDRRLVRGFNRIAKEATQYEYDQGKIGRIQTPSHQFGKTRRSCGLGSIDYFDHFLSVGRPARRGSPYRERLRHILRYSGIFLLHDHNVDLAEFPPGTKIYYDQITAGPSAGPGYLDSNVFVYVKPGHWAVGRCTVPNDNTPGICTLSDGIGALARFSARINVTYKPGGDGALYAWDGTYSLNDMRIR